MVAPSNPPSCFVYGADRRDPRPVFGHRLNEFWLVPKEEKRKEREKVENHITTATKNPNDSDFSARKKRQSESHQLYGGEEMRFFPFFSPRAGTTGTSDENRGENGREDMVCHSFRQLLRSRTWKAILPCVRC